MANRKGKHIEQFVAMLNSMNIPAYYLGDEVPTGEPNVTIRYGGRTLKCEVRTKYVAPDPWKPIKRWRVVDKKNQADWLIRLYVNRECDVFRDNQRDKGRLHWNEVPEFIVSHEQR